MEFEELYRLNWQLAYDEGVRAYEAGLPRNCVLQNKPFVTPSGNVLKVYKSAWEQGWDGHKIPSIFGEMEAILIKMPLRPFVE
jgi:hypothetical protein